MIVHMNSVLCDARDSSGLYHRDCERFWESEDGASLTQVQALNAAARKGWLVLMTKNGLKTFCPECKKRNPPTDS